MLVYQNVQKSSFGMVKCVDEKRDDGNHIIYSSKTYFCGIKVCGKSVSRQKGIKDAVQLVWGQMNV